MKYVKIEEITQLIEKYAIEAYKEGIAEERRERKEENEQTIGGITERMLRQETIGNLKMLRKMINTSIRWKERNENG